MKRVKDLLRRLRDAGKLLTSALLGILSLAVNAWLVLTVKDWSGQHWYNPAQDIITSGAATAAILITIFIYSPEVVKVLAETFLNKRYQAGKDDGHTQGHKEGRMEGLMEGRIEGLTEGRTEERAELLKFIEEHPEMTLEQVMEHLRQRSGNGRNGKAE